MGLAGPKKRRKISSDPNNTSWSGNEGSFGRKILAAHGWTPGAYLGAKGAAQADHFSAANASHIRVLLKEDTLGLGAKRGKTDDSNFGLHALQDIYGRLNGKPVAQVAKEQSIRADLGRQLYAEQRWGPSRFVSGGLLVGDKIEEAVAEAVDDTSRMPLPVVVDDEPKPGVQTIAKRKLQKMEAGHSGSTSAAEDEPETREERQRRRLERRQRKAEKRARKEAKAKRKEQSRAVQPVAIPSTPAAAAESRDGPMAPAQIMSGRNAVRSRFIRQKRMASMDPQALREILMLKS